MMNHFQIYYDTSRNAERKKSRAVVSGENLPLPSTKTATREKITDKK